MPDSNLLSLDELDRRLLAALQSDAGRTNLELAKAVHASAATTLRRVNRLIERGVIERVVAIVNPGLVGLPLTAILEVTLDHQGAERLDEFESLLSEESAVTQCYRISGGPDFVVMIQVTSMDAYNAFVIRVLGANGNVRNVRSFFSTHRSKFETCLLLPR